ncbi:E3 ubiquitin-protein ligase MSL2b [Conger conger]|uniref:E3 ubiquitin-protein ligase MSL2b n=1 Tax=Conger conger TaxID=82655 RepID=UPI002A5A465D|nr:E3 ubiquitin-protein ligase MSL2b [Conger conger]XP_061094268.1 E3 ubiquitin-protein ligase MSL2b [Conger conger]XP_061094269.1 E3 ubiquitin-protein ligase MSL2b [Conger conger]
MNPVNATALYVSACRSVLQCDPRDPQSFAELCKLLPFFRQSLSCLVCGNLLQDPIAPTNSSCQHYVCKACKGKKMMMKPSCSWCKDYEQFEENKQLCILVECYRKLCEYITESPLAQQIASVVGGSSDILAMLREGLSLTEVKPEETEVCLSPDLSHSPSPSTSEEQSAAQLEAPGELPEAPLTPPSVNGLHDCNGLTTADELAAILPSPGTAASVAIDVCGTVAVVEEEEDEDEEEEELKVESFSREIPVCEAVAAGELCTDGIHICSFGEDIKHGSDPLLLSVEEVLRSLEPDPDPDLLAEDEPEVLSPSCLQASGTLNGPFLEAHRQPSLPMDSGAFAPCHLQPPLSGMSCSAATPRARPNRKRSRSESDSEKIQPLPISTIIRGPPLGTAPIAIKREPKALVQPVAAVPNGGAPKVTKTLLLSSKGIKKAPEHGAKKAYTKAKQGVPKTKDKIRERTPNNSLIPGSPTKVVYKKPQEKKGCKCGRATQNPSVLTCRGQRCPCYSNRKACLDCICRGCQNSYMANGEKKLEAFAVPEKALEQTRLTLGINVTSIAVRNAGASPSVLNVTAGSPVTSFLATSPHDDKSFDETLDMRFDC